MRCTKLRVHRYLAVTQAEGPGKRACIWVQGCPLRCPGCFLPETWDESGGTEYDTEVLAQAILDTPGLDGITYLGGEPFAQAGVLAHLSGILSGHGLSVMTFTGYRIEDLRAAGRADWSALLSATDLLVDGPFEKDLEDYSRPWVGSSNKRFHFLTGRLADFAGNLATITNKLEIRLSSEGKVQINGMAPPHILRSIEKCVRDGR